MAILENRTPPPPKPEKASRKEKRARQSAPVSEQEVEPGMDLPPNLIEPPHYFMLRTLNAKANDLVAANRQTVSQAGERYATVIPSPKQHCLLTSLDGCPHSISCTRQRFIKSWFQSLISLIIPSDIFVPFILVRAEGGVAAGGAVGWRPRLGGE